MIFDNGPTFIWRDTQNQVNSLCSTSRSVLAYLTNGKIKLLILTSCFLLKIFCSVRESLCSEIWIVGQVFPHSQAHLLSICCLYLRIIASNLGHSLQPSHCIHSSSIYSITNTICKQKRYTKLPIFIQTLDYVLVDYSSLSEIPIPSSPLPTKRIKIIGKTFQTMAQECNWP